VTTTLWQSVKRHAAGFQRQAIYATLVFALALLLITLFVPLADPRVPVVVAAASLAAAIAYSQNLARRSIGELAARKAMAEKARQSASQIEELFAMTDMLQAAEDHDDAGAVLMATATRLLPEFGGALYVFNNSRDRLDLAKSWNTSDDFAPNDTLLPSQCWALKRGKPHINDHKTQTLCCTHHTGEAATVEIPMMARGSVHGLLVIAIDSENAFKDLMEVRRLGRALADSMSLALSNIALREKLRTQSLRDPLTGLYNRRYMEDALDRYVSLTERTGGATSVVMIDLDNFKKVNDTGGHAMGDSVLRDVAAKLVSGLRPSDVVSRFGGEELVVILPGCDLEEARRKAELMRTLIESLSETHCTSITASFGVASVPETSLGHGDVIPMADSALYAAKLAGKNCVRVAERRAGREDSQPRLAATGRGK
jgi:diguanylate cyclase (GGDEF)-like protein